eukprot:13917967-Alexandrium_andersonii.AAC.1
MAPVALLARRAGSRLHSPPSAAAQEAEREAEGPMRRRTVSQPAGLYTDAPSGHPRRSSAAATRALTGLAGAHRSSRKPTGAPSGGSSPQFGAPSMR